MTTDGDTVYAIDSRNRIDGDRAIDHDRVIAQGEDAGAVVQRVVDTVTTVRKGEPIEQDALPGRHLHFTRGVFPWATQVSTTETNGYRITGQSSATLLRATGEIESFFDFARLSDRVTNLGPKIGYLNVHGEGNAEFFIKLNAHTDSTNVHDILCRGTNRAMIYGRGTSDENFEFFDTALFVNIRTSFGGALAIFEDGPSGIPAGCYFRHCFCYAPPRYAIILRNPQRIVVDRLYAGFEENVVDGDHGAVLVENPPPDDFQNNPDAQQCLFRMVELEDPPTREGIPVHFRVPEDATTTIKNHRVVFPRGSYSNRFVKADSRKPHQIRDVELIGAQNEPFREDAVEFRNTVNCKVNLTLGEADAREVVTIENGRRNTVNGVGRNAGDPSQTGEWNGSGYEGVVVWDTDSETPYWYLSGRWVALEARSRT